MLFYAPYNFADKKSCIIFALEDLDWSLFCDHISSSTIECWKWRFRIFCPILFWVTNLIFFTCLHEKFLQYVFFLQFVILWFSFFLRFYNRHHHITQKKLLSHSTVIVLRFFWFVLVSYSLPLSLSPFSLSLRKLGARLTKNKTKKYKNDRISLAVMRKMVLGG